MPHAKILPGLIVVDYLGHLVHGHRADGTVAKAITRVAQVNLIIEDEIGLLPISEAAAEGLYRLVDAAYEKRLLAVASNLHPAGFDQLMPKTLATATVDRLLHHAHVVVTESDSFRLSEAAAGEGGESAKQLNCGEFWWPPVGNSHGHHWGIFGGR